jgi:class 3 adenylate cyclase
MLAATKTVRTLASISEADHRKRSTGLVWSSARERKVVSVLSCDLVGFTAASKSADPEEVQARLAPYHARKREHEADGGTVERFIGDAVSTARRTRALRGHRRASPHRRVRHAHRAREQA